MGARRRLSVMEAKVVVISGCSSGIGFATALTLAKDKRQLFKVYATMRDLTKKSALEEAAGDCLNKTLFIKELDVSKEDSVKKFSADILKSESKIDILINNAGYGQAGSFEHVSLEKSRDLFETNLFGAIHLTQQFIPSMKRQKSGHILFISSTVSTFGIPFCEIYTASKCAIDGIAESLAPTLALFNVKVTIICPGPIDTKFGPSMAMFDQNESDEETMAIRKQYLKNLQQIISGNIQTSQEVAKVIKEAIEADKPNFRYYTSEKDLKDARAKLADTTGNAAIQFINNTFFEGVKLSSL